MAPSYHIAFVTLGFDPVRTSGMDIAGERVVSALLAADHRVTVIALQDPAGRLPSPEIHEGARLTVHRLPRGSLDWIDYSRRAAGLVAHLQSTAPFDVVHFFDVHFAYAFPHPFVATVHQTFRQRLRHWEPGQERPLNRVLRPAYYLAARYLAEVPALGRAAALTADSDATRTDLIRFYGIAPERIFPAGNFVDTAHFRSRPQAAAELRSRLGIAPTEPVLLFSGFITPRKGLSHLALALREISPAPWILTTGRWSTEQRAHFGRLLGDRAHRVLHQGFVADAQMPVLYSAADLYLSASLLEGFGLPLAEALACETPVVAATGGSVAEVVGPGGIVTAARDGHTLAAAASSLLADVVRRRELGASGRAHVQAHFDARHMVDHLLPAYQIYLDQMRSK